MLDIIQNEIKIGDKVSFIPPKRWHPQSLQYGIVIKMSNNNEACYCKSLNYNHDVVLRYSNQIIKLN